MRRIKQLRSLSGDERYFLARAVFWLPVTSLLLHLVGFRHTLAFFKRGKAFANYESRFPAPACGGRRLRSTALNNAHDPSGPASFARLPNQGQARKLLNGGLPAGQEALKAATARPWVACGSNSAITSHHRHTAKKAARMIDIAANHGLYRARCLQKSLVLIKFMRACDIPCSLVLGARRQGDAFGAHAWVECGGVVVNDDADVGLGFTPFNAPAERTDWR